MTTECAADHRSPRPGRPRRAETDARILSATIALIREHGPQGVNVASVAAASGIARTTIYRRYADREALLRAALGTITERGAPPAAASVPEKLAWVLTETEQVIVSGLGPGGIAAVLAGGDPEFAAALRAALADGLEPIRAQLAEDLASGAVRGADPAITPETVVDIVVGTCLAELLRHGAVSNSWRERTNALLLHLLRPAPAAGADL